ncbi:RidA family protein [uncultured Sulfitobacter sp.]|uniref:RidA family protein n=1 Tax=uncultured Sulfitobacter sp. TaxID=191468 RepID=UPI002595994B|nr:RidA family protein [uncultured Sulfitobacter sp.]
MTETAPKPIAQGLYKTAVRYGRTVQTSGLTPRRGNTLLNDGIVQKDDDPEKHRAAVRIATENAVAAVQGCLEVGENIGLIAQLVVYIATEPGVTKHAQIADHASRYLVETFGVDIIGTRAAIGVASLPSNAPVEITITAIVE